MHAKEKYKAKKNGDGNGSTGQFSIVGLAMRANDHERRLAAMENLAKDLDGKLDDISKMITDLRVEMAEAGVVRARTRS